ncbi:heptaprenyl diphosphate synthase [Mariprofundus micogutta]|uniref:Heptaprenyl diphosphate synthase n=2 Tax=Mariprofundus micogutta TaxID=1921010 RepID=A0A1L8CL94_9PROT|nr:heptaprenyl diphosphate synthase [Mariprofundus micogutta]
MIPRPSLSELERKGQWLALLLLAIGLHVFEAALPSLGPWFKPGLANLVTLLVLVLMGPRAAIALAIGRVVVGSFFIGTLFTPTFVVSMAGGLAAAMVMIMAWRCIPGISLIGISLLAALAHMLAQFITVESLFIQQSALYYALPPLLLLSCITGWINGALARYISARLTDEL